MGYFFIECSAFMFQNNWKVMRIQSIDHIAVHTVKDDDD